MSFVSPAAIAVDAWLADELMTVERLSAEQAREEMLVCRGIGFGISDCAR